jgi:hypothetical protein
LRHSCPARQAPEHAGALMQKWLQICLLVTFTGGCIHSGNGAPRRAQNEISQLSAAVDNFKEHFGAYPPSRIKLSETCNYPDRDRPGTLDADSVSFLHLIWPAFDLDTGGAIDWNGDHAIKGDWTLEGDECLVFFLGGVQFRAGETNGYMGFSTDPKDRKRPAGPVLRWVNGTRLSLAIPSGGAPVPSSDA